MLAAVVVLLRSLRLICGGHRAVALENLALRQQLSVFRRTVRRPQLRTRDRLFWVLLANTRARVTNRHRSSWSFRTSLRVKPSNHAPALNKPKSRPLLPSQDRHYVHAHCGDRRQHRCRAGSGGEGQDGGREALRIGGTDANQKTRDKAPADR
jgi:hypothetical protein